MARSRAVAPAVCLGIVMAAAHAARADPVEDYYRGKSVNLVVSSAVGGGHDILARAVAKFLPRHIPGNPQIVARNVPGAGGLIAANNLYNVAARDGLTIAQFQNTLPFEPVFGNREATFDPTKFLWLGTQATETAILVVWKNTPVASVDDIKNREITVGTAGVTSMSTFNSRVLAETLGMKLKIIPGYPGQAEVFLAMEKGEVDSFPSYYSSLMGARPDWVANRDVRIIVQFGPEPEAAIPEVPFAGDLVTDPAKKLLLRAATAPQALGRPFLMPPGTPDIYVAAMRKAFAETFRDPEYLAEAKKLALTINRPSSGEELQKVIEEVWRMPEDARAQLRRLSGNQQARE